MSSYISYLFRYLFHSDHLSAELNANPASGQPGAGLAQAGASGPAAASAKCLRLATLVSRLATGSRPSAGAAAGAGAGAASNQAPAYLRSLADFESAVRQALELEREVRQAQQEHNERAHPHHHHERPATSAGGGSLAVGQWSAANSSSSGGGTSELIAECYQQLQLQDYYSGYDMLIGLRIASSLTILFVVFILFVIYKTGCRERRAPWPGVAASSEVGRPREGGCADACAGV